MDERDERRYRELLEKRSQVGLCLEEAKELGRLITEAEGRTHSPASSLSQDEQEKLLRAERFREQRTRDQEREFAHR